MARLYTALLVAALLIPQNVFAAGFLDSLTQYKKGNLKFGKLKVSPYATLAEHYDSNIYLVPPDKADGTRTGGGVLGSWIHDLGLGFKLKFPMTKMHGFDAGYGLNFKAYSKQPSANNAFYHNLNLGYNYSGPMGITARVWDTYLNTEDPAFSELVTRETRWQNTFGAKGEYAPKGGMFFGGAQFDQVNHKYVSPSLGASLNRYEQTFGVKGGYMLQPKTRVYLGLRHRIIHYSVPGTGKNNKAEFVDFGIEGTLLPKLKGQVQTGVTFRDYEELGANRTGFTRNWMVGMNLMYKPLKRTDVRFGLSRALNESTFGVNRFYVANLINVGVQHKFPYKLTGKVGLGWGIDRYPESTTVGGVTANRRDDTYTQSLGVDYALQEWVTVGLAYQHKERNSIFTDQYNYEQHLTSLSCKLQF